MSDEFKNIWTLKVTGLDRFLQPGDSIAQTFELLSFSHGIQEEPPTAGQPRRVSLYEFSAVRYCDPASPYFMRLCQTGDQLPQVVASMRSENDGKIVFLMRFELQNARVTGVRPGGSSGSGMDSRPVEEVCFRCEKMKVYVEQAEQRGSATLNPPRP